MLPNRNALGEIFNIHSGAKRRGLEFDCGLLICRSLASDEARRPQDSPRFGNSRMGYFVLTTVCTLTWLGYVPIPKQVLIGACVVYVLYDAFKR
jgi:hypothetical protein